MRSDTDRPAALQERYREAQRALSSTDYRRAHELCLKILEQAPDFAGAFFLLGVIAAEHGNFGKAVEVIEQAIRIDPLPAAYHAQLSRCLIALHRPREALESALRARQAAPSDAWTWDTVGVALTRAGAHAEAVEPLRRAVQLAPKKAAYRYNLGAALQFIGELEAARREYRAAVELEPRHYRAWASLSQVMTAPFDAQDLAHLHAAFQSELPVDAQLQVAHALAKHYEDIGEHAQAFEYLQRGKQRKRASINYSSADDRVLFDAVRRVCTSDFLQDPTPGCDSTEPIFIVGMPRTGTTLAERIISSHPQVFAAGELSNFSLVLKRAASTSSNLVLDEPTLAAVANLDLAAVGREYVASTRPRTGHTPRFIDKMPMNFLYAGIIRRALPNAKIICLRRNALDACLSNYRQLFAIGFTYYNYAYDLLDTGRYYLMFDELARYWRASLGDNYCEVQYEDVVSDTEAQARRLTAFCGLEWDAACLRFHENAAPVATASSVQVRRPIYRTSLNRWQRYEKEIAPLRALLESAGVTIA